MVREQWRGDLSLVIEYLVPLVMILRPEVDVGQLLESDSDEAVVSFVNRLEDARLRGAELIQVARAAGDMYEFGCQAYQRFGSPVQLSRWNAALVSRGGSPLENKDAVSEFRRHLDSAGRIMRSVIAALLEKHLDIGGFEDLTSRLDATECPTTFRADHGRSTSRRHCRKSYPCSKDGTRVTTCSRPLVKPERRRS